jgi:hypothetical protein
LTGRHESRDAALLFLLVEGERLLPDRKGEDLANDGAAREEALHVAEELCASAARGSEIAAVCGGQ